MPLYLVCFDCGEENPPDAMVCRLCAWMDLRPPAVPVPSAEPDD